MLRVLIANKVGPILLIAFTNHALDHILINVLEKKITNKIVRLGSRSSHEVVSEYSLDNLSVSHSRSQMAKATGREYRGLKLMEEEMTTLMSKIVNRTVDADDMNPHLAQEHPTHYDELVHPPYWIQHLFEESQGWKGADGRNAPKTLFDFWKEGGDLRFITPPTAEAVEGQKRQGKAKSKKVPANRYDQLAEGSGQDGVSPFQAHLVAWTTNALSFFGKLGHDGIPVLPSTSRAVAEGLLHDWEVWKMSATERRALADFWVNEVRETAYANQTREFELLQGRHDEARKRWEGMRDQVLCFLHHLRWHILKNLLRC